MITVTPNAAEKIRRFIAQQGNPNLGLRIRVVGGGCSGLQYQIQFDSRVNSDDRVIEVDGVKILIDMKSALFLRGVELDYEEGLMGKGFRFKNPNAKGTCGCGESFYA